MSRYIFQSDEVVLFETEVKRNDIENVNMKLTNYALIFDWITVQGKLLKKTKEEHEEICPLESIKFYEGAPQIKQKDGTITIQTLNGDEKITLDGFFKTRDFVSKLKEAVTGQKASQRGAKKINGAIGVVNEALGIDTIEAVSGVLKNGIAGTVLGSSKSDILKKMVLGDKTKSEKSLTDKEKIDLLKEYNTLKESGVISQDEFEAKKKEIFG